MKHLWISMCLAAGILRAEPLTELPPLSVVAESRIDALLAQPRLVLPSLEIAESVVTRADIQRQGAETLTESLRYQPGVWTETRGRKVKQFTSFRGQIYPYPDYAWNGLWLPEFHEMPYFVPAAALERVEVVRSSAGLFMGMSGDVGVINLVPRAPGGPARAEAFVEGTKRGGVSVFQPMSTLNGGWAVAGGVVHDEGPGDRHGRETLLHAMLSGRHRLGPRTTLDMQVLAVQAERELLNAKEPAAKRLRNTLEVYDPYQGVLVGARLNREHDDAATTSLGFGAAYRTHDFVNQGDTGHISLQEDDYSLTADVTHVRRLTDDNRVRVGAVYNRWVAPNGKRFFEGRRTDVHTLALVVADEQRVGNVLFDVGARVTRRYLRDYGAFSIDGSARGFGGVEDIADEWEEPRPRLTGGARWFLSRTVEGFLHAGIDRIDARDGALAVDGASPDTETRWQTELGLRHTRGDGGTFNLSAFQVQRDDALLLDAETALTPSGLERELYRNQDLRQRGIEASARDIPIHSRLSAFANLTYIQSEAKDDGGDYQAFGELPDWIGAAGLQSDWDVWRVDLYGKWVSRYENARFSDDKSPKPLGDFVDLQIRLSRSFGNHVRVTAFCRNLLDDRYSTVVGYPDEGRRYGAEVLMTW